MQREDETLLFQCSNAAMRIRSRLHRRLVSEEMQSSCNKDQANVYTINEWTQNQVFQSNTDAYLRSSRLLHLSDLRSEDCKPLPRPSGQSEGPSGQSEGTLRQKVKQRRLRAIRTLFPMAFGVVQYDAAVRDL